VGWLIAFLVPLLSLVIFRPWVPESHPVWDWGDLVPLFQGADGVLSTVAALAERYGAEGRANLLGYLQLAITWELFGESAVGWQVGRAVLMVVMATIFVAACRRAGASPAAAGLGGLVLLLGTATAEGFLFIMGEPLGVCFLIGIFILTLEYPGSDSWRRDAVWIGILALALLLTKEFMGIALPPLVMIALCGGPSGYLRLPRWDARTRWLVGVLTVVLVLEVILLLTTLQSGGAQGYAAAYGTGDGSSATFFALVRAMTLPTWFASSSPGTVLYPSNFLAVLLFLAGGVAALRHCWPRVPALVLLGLLPLVGAAAYSLWPRYSAFYGIPFWTGAAALMVASATLMGRRSRIGWVVAPLTLAVMALYAGIVADRTIREKHAFASVAEQVVRALPSWPGVDSLLMAVPAEGGRRWPVTGPELERYARALGVVATAVPPSRDATCTEVADRLRTGLTRVALINDRGPCGQLPVRTGMHTRVYQYLDWIDFRWRRDSVAVESLVPSLFGGR